MSDGFEVDPTSLGVIPAELAAVRERIGALDLDHGATRVAVSRSTGSYEGDRSLTSLASAIDAFAAAAVGALSSDIERIDTITRRYRDSEEAVCRDANAIEASARPWWLRR